MKLRYRKAASTDAIHSTFFPRQKRKLMINPDKCKAIYLLHEGGMKIREFSRRLSANRKTVSATVAQKGAMPELTRKGKIGIDPELLRRLYRECKGWVQRIHEKLTEEQHIQVGYSKLR